MMPNVNRDCSAKTLEKGLRILNLFDVNHPSRSLTEIAAPILSRGTGYPLGAISFTSTTLDPTLAEFEDKYANVLCELARKLSEVIPNT